MIDPLTVRAGRCGGVCLWGPCLSLCRVLSLDLTPEESGFDTVNGTAPSNAAPSCPAAGPQVQSPHNTVALSARQGHSRLLYTMAVNVAVPRPTQGRVSHSLEVPGQAKDFRCVGEVTVIPALGPAPDSGGRTRHTELSLLEAEAGRSLSWGGPGWGSKAL